VRCYNPKAIRSRKAFDIIDGLNPSI